ncbi:Outer membrane receptor proteins, mostly Fe transport [Muriicola jejuensis]|uniref:TonB-dependent receptor plug domain-containing protein n=1 Tax=Muriicola jejuensis TaxID=504488 RepID=A0A6P0UAT5_9FLAO|nr:TonB-dependent receptor plug domain-containing protein [Muriicola jejuensis]NER09029.1 TonB-dependent receptor plug domain-containing protein [Muriicola jejuensis]SMP11991.1 Outer membrane receptor proteins, mostly Fe transport [Muriicola jejuensis]
MNPLRILLFSAFFCVACAVSGQTATITGVVLGSDNRALSDVSIRVGTRGTISNTDGFYLLEVESEVPMTITFSHIGHQKIELRDLILTTNQVFAFNPVMKTDAIQIDSVEVTAMGSKTVSGISNLSPELVQSIPGANPGVENLLKLLPGVFSNNELSTQYGVRGGNYDENLVYVNGIEVYRPQLLRSGQQEGFSYVNSSMVERLHFSPGGFQARYGDKLSSVLDITYKSPTRFAIQAEASLLGLGTTLETRSKDKKFTTLTGFRYRDNSLLVNSQQTLSRFNPLFTDLQSVLTYRFTSRFHLHFLGYLGLNRYRNQPVSRQTNFGTLANPQALRVFYLGREENSFATGMGAIKAEFFPTESTALNFYTSVNHSQEEEYSDIVAQYELGEIETSLGSGSLGEVTSSRGIGSQYNRARNDLDALILTWSHEGDYRKGNTHLSWGLKYSYEDIRDQIRESEFIDSAGFFIRPPREEFINNQPEEPFTAPLLAYNAVSARNFTQTSRLQGFIQFTDRWVLRKHQLTYTLGLRSHHWVLQGEGVNRKAQFALSPRAQLSFKPEWERDIVFRLSTGIYQQPPFYRELRNASGTIVPEVEAQKSYHLVLGAEQSLRIWNRPFNLQTEVYYKNLWDVNTYTLEDVRIRYVANNDARAYAYGADLRLYGAFIPGTESWISLGYLKTMENWENRGYISRPTDQRFKAAILWQDYVPDLPQLKMYLNLVYSTGVPGGSPSYADPYIFRNRLRDYKRADLGISHTFVDQSTSPKEGHWLRNCKELQVGLEIFNLFNNQNSITNTWVRDVDSKNEYAVPNFMTSRILNVKLRMRF